VGTLQDYFDFVMTHAPYFYWLPDSEEHDPTLGRGAFVATVAIDFLYECYNDSRFESEKTNIYDKIVELADFILTQQCTDPAKKAYGGFKSAETSISYYSVDACRAIPGLLHAYALTNTANYLNAAKLAGGTFLKTILQFIKEGHVHYTDIEKKTVATCLRFATSNTVRKQFYGLSTSKRLCRTSQQRHLQNDAKRRKTLRDFELGFSRLEEMRA